MIRRRRCQSWSHLRLSGLPNPLRWPEQECKKVGVSVLGAVRGMGAAWQVMGCSLSGSVKVSAWLLLLLQWFSILQWTSLSLGSCRLILVTSLCKGLVIKSLGEFWVWSLFCFKSLMSLNVINRFVVKKLFTFDSGDESPDIPETFNYITDAGLVLRCKNVALIQKQTSKQKNQQKNPQTCMCVL